MNIDQIAPGVVDGAYLKSLQTRLKEAKAKEAEANAEWKKAKEVATQLQLVAFQLQGVRQDIEEEIRQLLEESKMPVISEHALLRYLERVGGIDIESTKKEMLSEQAVKMIKFINGNGKARVNGVDYIVKNNTIVTVTK